METERCARCGAAKATYGSFVIARLVALRRAETGVILEAYECPKDATRWHLRNVDKRMAKLLAKPNRVKEVQHLAQVKERTLLITTSGSDRSTRHDDGNFTGSGTGAGKDRNRQGVLSPRGHVRLVLARRKSRHNRFVHVRRYTSGKPKPRCGRPRYDVVASFDRMLGFWNGGAFDERDPLYRRKTRACAIRRANRRRERDIIRRALCDPSLWEVEDEA